MCNLENRLEADTLLTDISRTILLRRSAYRTNSFDIVFRESILIRINDDPFWIEFEGQKRFFTVRRCRIVRIVLGVLYKLI